jgi:GH3 auxin-responsive promoter
MSFKRFLLVRIGRLITWPVRRQLARFECDCERPADIQAAVLRAIVQQQRDTAFGRDHDFRNIRTAADFAQRVPLAPYDYHAPYIERVQAGETSALIANDRVLMFALTSGTTASRKLIPVTREYLRAYKRGWNMWGVKMYRDHRGRRIAMRPIVQMVGDPDEFRTSAGIPCGNLTGFTAKMQMRLIRRLYAVPHEVGKIKDPLAKYYVALRFALDRNVSQFMAANPSTLMQLARTLDSQREHLLKDLHDGTLREDLDLPADVRTALTSRASHNPGRSRELAAIADRAGRLYPQDVWPSDSIIINTWTGGSMGPYLRQLPQYFGETPIRDLGLLASEGRMTIPFANSTPSGVLDIYSHYFEFVPEGELDSNQPIVLRADEIEAGRSYYILPTTRYGLYRYHISDLVRVTGFLGRTPLVEFLGKGHRFANLTGEKLSEHHVTKAMDVVLKRVPQPVSAYTLAPIWHDERPYYGLFLEERDIRDVRELRAFVSALDAELGVQNVEYAAKRESGRLGELRVQVLPAGAWATWDAARLAKTGGAAEQYKRPCLMGDTNFYQSMTIVREV